MNMKPVQQLPATYQKIGAIDLKQNGRLMLLLNILGLVGMFLSGYLFFRAILWLRPEYANQVFSGEFRGGLVEIMMVILEILGLTVINILLHEGIHGIFFWLFTGSRPQFAFRWTYAYAAAPDWYIPRNQYLVTSLAPLVLISLLALGMFTFVPSAWLLAVWFVAISNASGAVGDLAVALWLVRQPATCLAQDRGDAVTLYTPQENTASTATSL